MVTEGARTVLMQSGLSEAWWPFAMLQWIAMWNGFVVKEDGHTPYYRRFRQDAPYKQYPFGALVPFHPHRLIPQPGSDPVHEKMHTRLVPAVLVEVTLGPAGQWGSCYGVAPLIYVTSEHRASKAAIRISCDLVFPDRVSFPLTARLMLHGALEEINPSGAACCGLLGGMGSRRGPKPVRRGCCLCGWAARREQTSL